MRVIMSSKRNVTVVIKAQLSFSLPPEILKTALTPIELLFGLVLGLSLKIFSMQLTPVFVAKNVTE